MPARVEPDADDVSLGAVSIGVDQADPRQSGDAGNLCSELVVHGADTPGHTTLGNAIPALGFSGVVGPGVDGLLLSSSPSSLSPPVN
jgi:hypothetical protein